MALHILLSWTFTLKDSNDSLSLTDIAAAIGAVLTGIGVIFTGIGLIYTAVQIRRSRKIARSEFLLHLYELMGQHDELHARLTEHGWPGGRTGPDTREDWIEVGRLMGIFEYIQILVEDRVLDVDTVDQLFSYRILPLVTNNDIIERHLTSTNDTWTGFKKLWISLKGKKLFCELTRQVPLKAKPGLSGQSADNSDQRRN